MKKLIFLLTCLCLFVGSVEAQSYSSSGITEIYTFDAYGNQVVAAQAVQIGNVIDVYKGGKTIQRIEVAQDPYSYSQVYDLSGGSAVKQFEFRTNSLGVNEIIDYRPKTTTTKQPFGLMKPSSTGYYRLDY